MPRRANRPPTAPPTAPAPMITYRVTAGTLVAGTPRASAAGVRVICPGWPDRWTSRTDTRRMAVAECEKTVALELALIVRDVGPEELADLGWSGGASHIDALAKAL